METPTHNKSSGPRRFWRAERSGFLVLILSVLIIGYLSLLNVQQGFREYRHLSHETMPVTASLEGLRFTAMGIIAAVSEFGMVAHVESAAGMEKSAAMAREVQEFNQGLEGFNRGLVHYRELVTRFFPLEIPGAERLFHEGNLLKYQARGLLTAIQEQAGAQKLFELKEGMEQNERRFLDLTTQLLEYEAREIAERNAQISRILERQVWVLVLGGLFLGGLALFQQRRSVRICRACSGREGSPATNPQCRSL